MKLLGNIIWLLFGGFFAALGYAFAGLILCCTVVGIPFGIQCFKLALLELAPFGKTIETAPQNTGLLRLLLNVVWILFGGFWIALGHIVMGAILFITIIGIPFARQHFKLVEVSLMPFGKRVL